VGNTLAEQTAKTPPTDEQLRKDLESERGARQRAENERDQFRGAAAQEWRGRQIAEREVQRLRAPKNPDAFESLAERGVAVPPDEQQALLDRGVRERTREEIGKYDEARRREDRGRELQRQTEQALGIFAALNPEIVNDEERFSGAIQRAQHRAAKQGLTLDPAGMVELAKNIYLEDRAKRGEPPPAVPFTEGPGMPGAPNGRRGKEEAPPEQNVIEEAYALPAGTIRPDSELDAHTERYIDQRNLELVDKEKFNSRVRQIKATILEGEQRRAAAAGR
jgi:hypothetical protein